MDSPGSTGYVDEDELDLRGDVIEALNSAKTAGTHTLKVQHLTEAREIVLHRDASFELLRAFAPDFAEFHTEKKAAVRFFVINFIEDACKLCKDVIPMLLSSLVYLVHDKNSKNQTKVWVTVMNLYRPALSLLCDVDAIGDSAKRLAEDLDVLRGEAVKLLKSKKNKIMPVIDTVKTIALSYLKPNPNAALLNAGERERGPKEARVDTGPDSFSLDNIPIDHPVLSIVDLDKTGSEMVDVMCEELLAAAKEGDGIKPDSAKKSIPMTNAIQVLALYRPSVRDRCLECLLACAGEMKIDGGESAEVSQHKLRFVQNLRTNLLEFLKEKWRVLLSDWRTKIFEALCMIGAEDQGQRALAALDSRDEKSKKRLERDAELQERKRQKLEEMEAARIREQQRIVEAVDADELIRQGYPPRRNTWPWELISRLHEQPVERIVQAIVDNMEFLPGPPPPSSVQKSGNEAIRTVTQFDAYIDQAVANAVGARPAEKGILKQSAGEVASQITPAQTLEPRQMALERMLEQHKSNHNTTNLILYTGEENISDVANRMPSCADAMIARVACNFQKRSATEAEADLRPLVVNFAAEDLSLRMGLALSTLYHMFAYSMSYEEYDDAFMGIVEKMLENQDAHEAKGEATPLRMFRDNSWPKLFTTAPRVPEDAFAIVSYLCENKSKHRLGLKTIRDLTLKRVTTRSKCLQTVLCYACYEHTWVRDTTIQCISNQIYPVLDQASKKEAETFALEMLQSILEGKSNDAPDQAVRVSLLEGKRKLIASRGEKCPLLTRIVDTKEEEEGKEENVDVEMKEGEKAEKAIQETGEEEVVLDDLGNVEYQEQAGFVQAEVQSMDKVKENDILRRIALYVALCRRNHELLKGYLLTYAECSDEQIQKLLENAIVLLVQVLGKQLGADNALALFQYFPDMATPLVIHALRLLVNDNICDSAEKRKNLVIQAKEMTDQDQGYKLFDTDDRFVLPVLGSLGRPVIIRYLPVVVAMDAESVKEAIDSILRGARYAISKEEEGEVGEEGEEDEEDSQPLLPADLMLAIMNIPTSEEVTTQNLIDATELCFERKDMFTKDVLVQVISDALSQETLPRLLMRIMMQCMEKQPQIKPYIAQALSQLVDLEIWNVGDNDLWVGFIICAAKLATPAYPILFRLPPDQLSDAIKLSSGIPGIKLAANLIYFAKKNQEALQLPPEVLQILDAASKK